MQLAAKIAILGHLNQNKQLLFFRKKHHLLAYFAAITEIVRDFARNKYFTHYFSETFQNITVFLHSRIICARQNCRLKEAQGLKKSHHQTTIFCPRLVQKCGRNLTVLGHEIATFVELSST